MVNAGAIMVMFLVIRAGKTLDDLLKFYSKATGYTENKVDIEL